jgi:kynurenine formamidase
MAACSARWSRRPEGSNWGDFGPDDEIGRLNLITPETVLNAVKEVREGLSFCLSLPLELPGGERSGRFPPRLSPTGEGGAHMNQPLSSRFPGASGVTCDDAVELCLQYSTQWDGLSHYGCAFDADGDGVDEIVYYNGWRAHEDIVSTRGERALGAHRLGVETYAQKAIQTRGVLVDLDRHFGPERRRVDFDALQEVLSAQSIIVEPGDIVCIHSGIGRTLMELRRYDLSVLRHLGAEIDGSDKCVLDWITNTGMSAIAADNFAVEWFQKVADPAVTQAILPLHEHCLFRLGMPLGELWWLTPLAEALATRNRNRFLLTAPPLRLARAVGSPVTPVATI